MISNALKLIEEFEALGGEVWSNGNQLICSTTPPMPPGLFERIDEARDAILVELAARSDPLVAILVALHGPEAYRVIAVDEEGQS